MDFTCYYKIANTSGLPAIHLQYIRTEGEGLIVIIM